MDVTAELAFDLTPQGVALVERRRGNLFSQVDSVLSLLGSVAVHVREFALPEGAMQEAVDAYLARSSKR